MSAAVRAGYKLTEAGVIPEDWSVQLLNDVAVISRLAGAEYTSLWKETLDGEIVALRGFNIGMGQIIERDLVRITNKLSRRLKRSRLCKGDVVYPCVGSIGNAVVITEDDRYHIQQNIARITPDQSKMDSFFLANYLMSCLGEREVNRFNSSSSQPSVLVGNLRQYRVAMPPTISEQRAIATALSDVDALLANLDALIAKKLDLKVATMQQLLTGQTRLPGFSGEWEVKRLGDICEIGMGRTPPRLNQAYWGSGYKWLSIADLHTKIVSESKEEVTDLAASMMAIIPKGTLLMSFKLSLGRLCFAGCDLFTNEAICSFNKLQAIPEFLYYVLGRTDFSLYGKQAVKGYTLNKQSLKLVEVPFPPLPEQTAIAKVLSDMDTELTALEARRDKTRALKQGMMQELLTGRIRLN